MPVFTLEKKLPSTFVTKDLIKSIEVYLNKRAADIAKDISGKNDLGISIGIKITDALGTETLASIDEYAPIRFPDTTQSIKVSILEPHWPKDFQHLSIDIMFSKKRDYSRMQIEYDGPNARELVNGIAEGISACLATNRTMNSWFNPSFFGEALFFLLGCASFALSSLILFLWIYIGFHHVPSGILSLTFTLIILFYNLSKSIRTYSAFDSNRYDRYSKIWNYIFSSILGLIIFGIFFQKIFDWIISHFTKKG